MWVAHVPDVETELIQSMCRMVGGGATSQITIIPANLPDDDELRTLRTYAAGYGAVLSVDLRGGIVIQGGQPKRIRQPEKPAVRPHLFGLLPKATGNGAV